jgi:hypothetical protein
LSATSATDNDLLNDGHNHSIANSTHPLLVFYIALSIAGKK